MITRSYSATAVPYVALLCFTLLKGTVCINNDLVTVALERLGAPLTPTVLLDAAPFDDGVRPSRELQGEGFHRTLHIRLQAPHLPAARTGGVAASPCRAALLQPLPSGVFADPYQLEDLQRSRPGTRFHLVGPLDLEL